MRILVVLLFVLSITWTRICLAHENGFGYYGKLRKYSLNQISHHTGDWQSNNSPIDQWLVFDTINKHGAEILKSWTEGSISPGCQKKLLGIMGNLQSAAPCECFLQKNSSGLRIEIMCNFLFLN